MFLLLLSLFFVSGVSVHRTVPAVNITAPPQLEALTGSCLRIPCSFKTTNKFDNKKKISAVWIKKDSHFTKYPDNIVFNSSNPAKDESIRVIGNLKDKNCTTEFKFITSAEETEHFFRIENEGYMATAIDNPIKIQVKDSPPRPTIDISGDVKDLKEEESVTVTCSAPTPCPRLPPRLTWSLQDARSQTVENSDGTLTTKIQTTITLTDAHDGNIISCSASYPVDGGEQEKTSKAKKNLSVSYAPKNTSASISPSGLLSAGSRVNLSCSSRAKPPISSFTWFKSSKDGATNVSKGHFYSFIVTDTTDTGSFYCVAANNLGNQSSLWIHEKNTGVPAALISVVLVSISIGFIGLVFCVWWFRKRQTRQQIQSQTINVVFSNCAEDDNQEEEAIHYGQINFSKQPSEAPSVSEQDGTQQEDTVYTQVNVHSSAQAADGNSFDLYAQVKRK